MVKYIFEGNINFYEELYKSLDINDDDDNNSNEVCQITGMPLVDKYVTLQCGHKFNYDAIYTEINKQKFIFNTYTLVSLNGKEYTKFYNSGKNYFIRCPYCRCIQFELLPYYPDSIYVKKYGINSLEKTNEDLRLVTAPKHISHMWYGYEFTKRMENSEYCKANVCFESGATKLCNVMYTCLFPETNQYFCTGHIKGAIKTYKQDKKALDKKKREDEKEKKKQDKILEKEQKKKNKVKITNTVISQNIEIGEFNETPLVNTCSAILKSGEKKGQMCGAKIKLFGLCLRHYDFTKNNINSNEVTNSYYFE
jgi:hypothetical protein